MSDFGMRRMLGQTALTRRRMLQATAGAGLTISLTHATCFDPPGTGPSPSPATMKERPSIS